jgi:glycosyltransferase involved in cell wall biosynthesis
MKVLMATGGGISNRSGGVGTMMAALQAQWGSQVTARVIDTRGPGSRVAGILYFASTMVRFVPAAWWADVVHLHMTTRGSVVRKCMLSTLARALGRPVIVHMHGADFFAYYDALLPVWQRRVASSLRAASHVVVLGEGWRHFLIERAGLDESRVSVVRNAIAQPLARPRPEGEMTHLLFLGRLGERKGVPDLLAALASRPLSCRRWRATLAGDGEVAHFAGLVGRAGLAGRISLPGWVGRDEAARLLASADVLVLPSHDEALPMAVIEAMAHGVPVIATPVGVLGEILLNDSNALVVRPGDTGGLAEALVRLIDDAPLRRRLGQAGHAFYRAELDVAVTASQMFRLYACAAGARRQRSRRQRDGRPENRGADGPAGERQYRR